MTTKTTSTLSDQFAEQGYLHIPHLVDGTELQGLRNEAAEIVEFASGRRVPHRDYLYRTDPTSNREIFYRLQYPKKRSAAFRALYGHPQLLSIFDELVGPDFVVTDDALVVKLARSGTDFGWHRDTSGETSRAGDNLLVAGIDLDVSNQANGCLHVLPGSHTNLDLDVDALASQHGFEVPGAVPIVSEPGDVVVHNGNTLHSSKPNLSDTTRRTVYIAAIKIDENLRFYDTSPDRVRLELRWMWRAQQIRRSLGFASDEEPFSWRGSAEWRADVGEDEFVDWAAPDEGARARPATTA